MPRNGLWLSIVCLALSLASPLVESLASDGSASVQFVWPATGVVRRVASNHEIEIATQGAVVSAYAGKVLWVSPGGARGKIVAIEHKEDPYYHKVWKTYYAYLASASVKAGEKVVRGQSIGTPMLIESEHRSSFAIFWGSDAQPVYNPIDDDGANYNANRRARAGDAVVAGSAIDHNYCACLRTGSDADAANAIDYATNAPERVADDALRSADNEGVA